MDVDRENLFQLMDRYQNEAPAWTVRLNKAIITCSINQTNCINEQHRADGIRLASINILYNIAQRGGRSTQKELTESMSISKQALTLAVDTLESHGFVERSKSEQDRRVTYICLTKAGVKFLTKAQEKRREFLNSLAQTLTREEAERTIETLERVNQFYKDYLDAF